MIIIFSIDDSDLYISLYVHVHACSLYSRDKDKCAAGKKKPSSAPVINLSLSDSEAVGQKLACR